MTKPDDTVKLDDLERLTILRLDAEVRAARALYELQERKLNAAKEERDKWVKKYAMALRRLMDEKGVDLGSYTFDDETGVLTPLTR